MSTVDGAIQENVASTFRARCIFFDGRLLDFERSWKTKGQWRVRFCSQGKLGGSEQVDVGTPPKTNMEPLYEGAFSASMLGFQGAYRSKCFQDPQNPAKGFRILFSCSCYQGFGGSWFWYTNISYPDDASTIPYHPLERYIYQSPCDPISTRLAMFNPFMYR